MKNKELLETINNELNALSEYIKLSNKKELSFIMIKLLDLVKFINQNKG